MCLEIAQWHFDFSYVNAGWRYSCSVLLSQISIRWCCGILILWCYYGSMVYITILICWYIHKLESFTLCRNNAVIFNFSSCCKAASQHVINICSRQTRRKIKSHFLPLFSGSSNCEISVSNPSQISLRIDRLLRLFESEKPNINKQGNNTSLYQDIFNNN